MNDMETDYGKEKAQNDLQREVYIYKTLCELQTDLMVCKCMKEFHKEAKNPLEEWKLYLEKFKKEIDSLYERVSKKQV
jgi:hypothetical protein